MEKIKNIKLTKFFILVLFILLQTSSQAQTNKIIEHVCRVFFVNDELHQEDSYHIFVQDIKGLHLAEFDAYVKTGESYILQEAVVLDKNGKKIKNYSSKDVKTRSYYESQSFYDDIQVKTISLSHHDFPFQVKIKYTTTTKNWLFLAYWYPVIHHDVALENASLSVSLPLGKVVNAKSNFTYKYTADTLSDIVNHQWTVSNFTHSKKSKTSFPLIKIVPETFHYGVDGSTKSWDSFGSWNQRLLDGLDELSNAEKKKVDSLIYGITDKKEIIRVLNTYRQTTTRYVYVGLDIGGFKPFSAQYVCRYRYGDCKALTNYMMALLKYVGIQSYYTKIYGDDKIPVFYPEPYQQFNHVILYIPLAKDTIWIENTSPVSPIGYLGTFTQGRHALLVHKDSSFIIKTPELTYEDVKVVREYNLTLDSIGNGTCQSDFSFKGPKYEYFLYYNKEISKSKEVEATLYHEHNLKDAKVDTLYFTELKDEPKINVNTTLTLTNQFRSISNTLVLKDKQEPIFSLGEVPNLENQYLLDCPHFEIEKKNIKLTHFAIEQVVLPKDKELHCDFGSFIESFTIIDNIINWTSEFKLKRVVNTPENYIVVKNFIDAITKHKKSNKILIKKDLK